MAEYIEREAFLRHMKGTSRYFTVMYDIEEFPAADVVPVVRGRWLDTREFCGDYMCSNCDALYGTNKFNFCPNCGARMDGE